MRRPYLGALCVLCCRISVADSAAAIPGKWLGSLISSGGNNNNDNNNKDDPDKKEESAPTVIPPPFPPPGAAGIGSGSAGGALDFDNKVALPSDDGLSRRQPFYPPPPPPSDDHLHRTNEKDMRNQTSHEDDGQYWWGRQSAPSKQGGLRDPPPPLLNQQAEEEAANGLQQNLTLLNHNNWASPQQSMGNAQQSPANSEGNMRHFHPYNDWQVHQALMAQQQQQDYWREQHNFNRMGGEEVQTLRLELERATSHQNALSHQIHNLTCSLSALEEEHELRLQQMDLLMERVADSEAHASAESNAALEYKTNCTVLSDTLSQLREEIHKWEETCADLQDVHACNVEELKEMKDQLKTKENEIEELACAIEMDRVDEERKRYLANRGIRRKKNKRGGGLLSWMFGWMTVGGDNDDDSDDEAKLRELARSTLIHALQTERDSVHELEAALSTLQQNNSAMSELVSSQDSLIEELNDRVAQFEEDKVNLKAALRQLQKEIKEEAPKSQKIAHELIAAKEAIQKLYEEIDALKAEHADQLTSLETKLVQKQRLIDENGSKMSVIGTYVDQLEERLASFAIARRDILAREAKCQELEERNTRRDKEVTELEQQVQKLTDEFTELQALLKLLAEERTTVRKEKLELQQQRDSLMFENRETKEELDVLHDNVQRLNMELVELTTQLEHAKLRSINQEELHRTCEELKDQLEEATSKVKARENLVNAYEALKLRLKDEERQKAILAEQLNVHAPQTDTDEENDTEHADANPLLDPEDNGNVEEILNLQHNNDYDIDHLDDLGNVDVHATVETKNVNDSFEKTLNHWQNDDTTDANVIRNVDSIAVLEPESDGADSNFAIHLNNGNDMDDAMDIGNIDALAMLGPKNNKTDDDIRGSLNHQRNDQAWIEKDDLGDDKEMNEGFRFNEIAREERARSESPTHAGIPPAWVSPEIKNAVLNVDFQGESSSSSDWDENYSNEPEFQGNNGIIGAKSTIMTDPASQDGQEEEPPDLPPLQSKYVLHHSHHQQQQQQTRQVKFRKMRKAFSRTTGIHGLFTPRATPPPRAFLPPRPLNPNAEPRDTPIHEEVVNDES